MAAVALGSKPLQRMSTERECGCHSFAVALCAGLISGLTIGQAQYAYGAFVDPLSEEFASWTRVQINMALSVGMVVNAIVSPLAGIAIDRFGARLVVPALGLVCGLGWLLFAFTKSLAMLYGAFALIYSSFPSNTMIQGGKVVGAWFPSSRGKVMGAVAACNNLGGVLMIQLGTALEWRDAALVFAALQGVATVLYWVLVRDSRPIVPKSVANQPCAPLALKPAHEKLPLRSLRFWSVSFALSLCFYTYPAGLTQMLPALRADGVDAEIAAGCLSLVGVLGIASKVISGFLADRIGAKRTMQISLLIQLIAMGVLLLHGWLPAGSRRESLAWTGAAIYGLGFGAVGAQIPLIILEEYGVKIMGRALGIVGATFLVPGLIAPIVAGAVFDSTGQYTRSFAYTSGVFCVALLVLEILCWTQGGMAPRMAQVPIDGKNSAGIEASIPDDGDTDGKRDAVAADTEV
jgi:nitrate/nitrite transporter NarK